MRLLSRKGGSDRSRSAGRLWRNHVSIASSVGVPVVGGVPVRRVVPCRRRIKPGEVMGYLPVIRVLAARDFKAKYKQSALGPVWLVAQPLALLGALELAFNGVSHSGTGHVPYVVFAMVGLAAWSYFQAALVMGAACAISNIILIRKTPCPRLAFPISSLLATLPTLGLTLGVALVLAAVTGNMSPRVLLLPVGVVWLLALTAGVVAIAAGVAVRFRDVISALPIILQVGVFVAPIGYAIGNLHGTLRTLVELNPLTGVIEVWRWMVLSRTDVALRPVWWALGCTVAVVVVGWRVFGRLEPVMADII